MNRRAFLITSLAAAAPPPKRPNILFLMPDQLRAQALGCMGNRDVQIDMGNDTLTIKMGNQTTKLDLGKSETEAMQSITLKVGQSSIVIDQMGVTIKGMMIKVEGTVQTQVKGLITQVNGDAMLQAKGGITMIN